jgi:phosphatidylinositol alpha 1,6-mannosyltransferase
MTSLPANNPLRVALFTGNYNYIKDGVALTLNRLVRYLASQGVEVLIFAPTGPEPAFASFGEVVSVPSFPIPFRREYRIATGFPAAARQRLQDFKPDLIHIAIPDILGFQALRYGNAKGIPVVASFHSRFDVYLGVYGLHFMVPLAHKYMRWFYQQCVQVYPPSQSMADVIAEKGYSNDIRVWSRGIDPAVFNPQNRDMVWRRSLGIADTAVVVNFTSRIVKEKNTGIFCDSLKRLKAKGIDFRVLVVGEGPEQAAMRDALPDAIFAGLLGGAELSRAYASSDIFFFPSASETFGNVTLEAAASGLPCVCANATGSNSIVLDGKTGFLIDPRLPQGFDMVLERLIMDKTLRATMSKAAVVQALTFGWDRIMADLLANYREVIAQ